MTEKQNKTNQVVIPILLSGKAQAGKDTFADTAIEFLTKGKFPLIDCSKIAFADSLKEIARQMHWDGKKDIPGRDLLINLGGIGRAYNKELWIHKLVEKVGESTKVDNTELLSHLVNGIHLVFIPDCRYINEVETISKCYSNTVAIRINRINFDNGLTEEQKSDDSETQLDCFTCWDYVITNDKLADYKARVCDVTVEIVNKAVYKLISGYVDMFMYRGNTGDA